jgi:hypothetical protein
MSENFRSGRGGGRGGDRGGGRGGDHGGHGASGHVTASFRWQGFPPPKETPGESGARNSDEEPHEGGGGFNFHTFTIGCSGPIGCHYQN